MIRTLYIKDFALIDELEVEFENGLNILTGQTGAGKSIIIGALNMILGERADTEVIRQGADKAIAEAAVLVGNDLSLRELLEENAVDFSDELILRREIRQSGSRAFINDTPVNIAVLRQVGDQLVDLHGQHDHQMLLRDENHLGVIDQFDTVQPALSAYRDSYFRMSGLQKELRDLNKRERDLMEKTELYRFQVKELEDADLDPAEEDDLAAEMNLLDNAEDLDRKAAAISEIGNGDEISLMEMLNTIKLNLEDMARIEPEFETYLHEVNTARISIQEAVNFTERYRNRIEFNPTDGLRRSVAKAGRAQQASEKISANSVPEMISYYNEIKIRAGYCGKL
jgi:DNA repair protein RecN (Recombination protein N)